MRDAFTTEYENVAQRFRVSKIVNETYILELKRFKDRIV